MEGTQLVRFVIDRDVAGTYSFVHTKDARVLATGSGIDKVVIDTLIDGLLIKYPHATVERKYLSPERCSQSATVG